LIDLGLILGESRFTVYQRSQYASVTKPMLFACMLGKETGPESAAASRRHVCASLVSFDGEFAGRLVGDSPRVSQPN
jgi:hypothetical protein